MGVAVIDTGVVHLFLDAAVLQKVGLQSVDVFSQESISLMNQSYRNITNSFVVTDCYSLAVVGRVVTPATDLPRLYRFF